MSDRASHIAHEFVEAIKGELRREAGLADALGALQRLFERRLRDEFERAPHTEGFRPLNEAIERVVGRIDSAGEEDA